MAVAPTPLSHSFIVVVTALDMSLEFWRKQGYVTFNMTDEFNQAYVAAGAVQLRNTSFLSYSPDKATVEANLKQAGSDADKLLLERFVSCQCPTQCPPGQQGIGRESLNRRESG